MQIVQELLLDIWALVNEMSPYLLLGFLLAGLMHEFIPNRIYAEYLSRPDLRSVTLAALFGVPLPLCSCGVLPTAMGIRRQGASRGATTAFLISTPQTGVDSIIATYSLMGLPFAIIRPIAAFVTAIFGGALVNGAEREDVKSEKGQVRSEKRNVWDPQSTPQEENVSSSHFSPLTSHHSLLTSRLSLLTTRLRKALDYAFVDMVADIGKWLVVGLIVAGMITALVPDAWFSVFKDNSLLSILLVLCISVPMYVCATGSIPIAVALMMKGLTPGAALVLLMAGPACNVASMLVIHKVMGRRTLLLYLTAIVSGAVAFGLGIDYLLPREWFTASLMMQDGCCHEGGLHYISRFHVVCTSLLIFLLLNALRHRHHHDEDGCCDCGDAHCAAPTQFRINGMNCSHCARNVEQAIRDVEGVEDVSVSLSDKSATVAGHFDPEAVKRAVESIGYEII